MKNFLTIILPLLLVGCWLPNIKLNRDVLPEEIIGTWTLTGDSWKDLQSSSEAKNLTGSHKNYSIEIRKDGTLHHKSITRLPTETAGVKGTWSLDPNRDQAGNHLSITLQIEKGPWSFDLYFTDEFSKDGKILLWQYFGDPDEFRLEMYEKTNVNSMEK
jgi:hypothetical protein